MSKTILIIEDEIALQDVYKFILSSNGYNVAVADNGMEGLKKVKEQKPDLILLDMFMPIMDGREFMRNIDLDDYPNTKILVYTNLSDSESEYEMRMLGAHDFVLKASVSPKRLLELVAERLA